MSRATGTGSRPISRSSGPDDALDVSGEGFSIVRDADADDPAGVRQGPGSDEKPGLGPARARGVDDGVRHEPECPRLFQHLGEGLDIADRPQGFIHVARDHGSADGHDIGLPPRAPLLSRDLVHERDRILELDDLSLGQGLPDTHFDAQDPLEEHVPVVAGRDIVRPEKNENGLEPVLRRGGRRLQAQFDCRLAPGDDGLAALCRGRP